MTMIRRILLDVGNVLVRLRPGKGLRHLQGHLFWRLTRQALSEQEVATVMTQAKSLVWPTTHRMWRSDTDIEQSFRTALSEQGVEFNGNQERLFLGVSDEFEPMTERIALLQRLQVVCSAALLSDTVSWHVQHIESQCPEIKRVPWRFYSCNLRSRKEWGSEIFIRALQLWGVSPDEAGTVLMVDDRPENEPGCTAAGINFLHVLPDDDLALRLAEQGIHC